MDIAFCDAGVAQPVRKAVTTTSRDNNNFLNINLHYFDGQGELKVTLTELG